jgi:hypothetical protein
VLILIIVVAVPSTTYYALQTTSNQSKDTPYFGVSFGGNTTEQAQVLIDRVKNFTNLFVVQAGATQHNETFLTEVCDLAVASGLNIIVYFGYLEPSQLWQFPWILNAQQKYGSKLLGIYYYDEPGGIELDFNWEQFFNVTGRYSSRFYHNTTEAIRGFSDPSVRNYTTATQSYLSYTKGPPTYSNVTRLHQNGIDVFVSDYALFWFDYKMGYDTVFAEFFANHSVTKDIALVRGAANMQNKSWGAILTWSASDPQGPVLSNATEMLSQLKTCYAAGAKYMVIFDYPYLGDNPYGILSNEQLESMETFWRYMQSNPQDFDSIKVDNAMVMPKEYGFGLRSAEDGVWKWGPDNRSATIYNLSQQLLAKYGLNLDIVYDDPDFPLQGNYTQTFWCGS